MTVSGTTISVNSTDHEPDGNYPTNDISIICDNKGGFAFSKIGTDQAWHIGAGTVSAAGAIAVGGLSHIANNNQARYDAGTAIGYEPDNDRYVPFGRNTDGYVRHGVYTRSANSTTINNVTLNGSPNNYISSVINECFDVVWDEVNSQFFIIYESSVNNVLRYQIGKLTGALTSLTNVASGNLNTSARMDVQGRIAYDKATGHAFWLYADSDGTNTKLLTVTISGTSVSQSAETIASHKEQGGLVVGCNGKGLLFTGVDKSDNSDINTRAKQFTVTTSNIAAGTFVGFSAAAYSDGDTATIKVLGNTTTQSSLTPAKTYYVQKAGTLNTLADNPSVEAGLALTSTKLLIKG